MPSNHLILCHPLLLLPSIFPSIMVFPSEPVLYIRWPKNWSFSFSTSPSNEYSGFISSKIDWFDLLVVQGTLKSLLHHHSSKISVLWHSAFFMVQLSHPYMASGKAIALTIQTFFGKVMFSNHLMLCHPLFLLPSIFPSIRVFPVSWLFISGDQNIGASASATVLPMNIQGSFSLGLTGLISLQSKGLSRVFSITTIRKHRFFSVQPSL